MARTDSSQAHVAQGPVDRPRLPLSVVTKPTGAACNLDCQYCFFLSKELLYDVPRQLMSEDTARVYVRELLAASPDGEVTLLWQGGEPTLRGLPFYQRVLEMCETYRRPTQQVRHALQTNATLIDETWAAFLAEHDVLVGVSVDGPAPMHDAYRVNRGGRGTHSMVLRGYWRLREAGVRTNVLCTLNAANQEHPLEVYRYLRDELSASYIQFIPIVERVERGDLSTAEAGWRSASGTRLLYTQSGDAVTSRSVSPLAYGRFLSTVFDEWVRHDVGRVFVQDFDGALSALFGIYPVCVHAPQCGVNLAMEFNGDVYACDHWVEPGWRLGSVLDSSFAELALTPVMRRFSRKKQVELTAQCRRCPVVGLCHGGCPKDRFECSVDGEEGHNYLCQGYASFYSHILPDLVAMARLLRAGRAPAEVMDPGTRERIRAAGRGAVANEEGSG
ncbi:MULTISPECIES: anaerobic sulfatase maturase [unclassified Actinomyces]|uniref:anaerobic sulfatase maturase n=1 Tax=unclassified Actinomyces TaxID=2609248 RepID=UPI00201715A8|nr:anaerobic sulfatase maturase [Actinomyces sp. 217892]